jgi:hypothetical protein
VITVREAETLFQIAKCAAPHGLLCLRQNMDRLVARFLVVAVWDAWDDCKFATHYALTSTGRRALSDFVRRRES